MTRELFWLTLTVILTGLLWVPYIINRCQVRGLSGAMANPSRNDKPQAEWANRLMFAHDNATQQQPIGEGLGSGKQNRILMLLSVHED